MKNFKLVITNTTVHNLGKVDDFLARPEIRGMLAIFLDFYRAKLAM